MIKIGSSLNFLNYTFSWPSRYCQDASLQFFAICFPEFWLTVDFDPICCLGSLWERELKASLPADGQVSLEVLLCCPSCTYFDFFYS